ncbi:Transforming growth factor-beta receptor-associated protein 1 [Colletotrichum orbiculare MAFF 240422]|uniref:Transforming growth factor-beta receptor-associated protein 1 n=1 Tax=Colletotrichum orbiculare (strain 104-T / ATCC 96160 / CBS 514.97 / LARS 414 / MAFF 240422) TaxID=1213857 RepID=N4VB05_COLOR|nr:Transforming growth factor-beta receptor-associated protein 1 [Colletotrichum orbiculare MAFF 240422]
MTSEDPDSDRRSSASGASFSPTATIRNDGPYVLRTLLDEVPLSADGAADTIHINCVEYLDHNLYIGTSASELLHFVQIPPDPKDAAGRPAFILASRLRPAFAETTSSRPGVQQILLLPKVGKAVILCNSTATFYSLPELSPVFGTTQVKNCNWVGGVDLNQPHDDEGDPTAGVFILLSLNRRIQLVRIGDVARAVKNIDVPGTTVSVRRDSIACVADARSYSLLDVERQLRIPLMTISSLDDSQPAGEIGQAQNIAGSTDGGILRSASAAQNRPLLSATEPSGHARSTSLGGLLSGRRDQSPRADDRALPTASPPPSTASPRPSAEASVPPPLTDKPLPAAPGPQSSPTQPLPVFLKPHIVSPSAEEFLLVTGTSPLDPGIGMFVNLDGEITRATVEFDKYPREIVIDGGSPDPLSSKMGLGPEEEGYVIASMTKEFDKGLRHGLEIQRWHSSGTEPLPIKHWLEADSDGGDEPAPLGIRSLMGTEETYFQEIVDSLCQRKFSPFSGSGIENPIFSPRSADVRTASSLERMTKERELFERDTSSQEEDALPEGWEASRNIEEEDFARRLANASSRIAVWTGNHVWWAIRNPLLLRLESQLAACEEKGAFNPASLDRHATFSILNSFRGQDAKSELEFVTFSYLRQRAGVLLLTSLLHSKENPFPDADLRALEEVLVDSSLDPRVVLSLVPGLRNEIVESRRGIWVFGGVKGTTESYLEGEYLQKAGHVVGELDVKVMQFLRRFLAAWRKKKGFGSVADESEVFRTVDAALLLVLLELDQSSPKGLAKKSSSVRSELYDIVDKGVDCFERAAGLLETYHRLFVLSRLYQSRKMAGDVLATWRRIVEGERDDGGELQDGEQRVREYLTKISSQTLVREYGVWLAGRNPKLGVQVFAEDKGKAPRFEPAQVVAILREEAPDAVKYYLEHLVFGKGHTGYVNELIAYYLDIVIGDLESSPESRDAFAGTYTAYRALQAPKPTYRQFLTDNAPEDDEVWQSRLRLLQLLGGAHNYDAAAIRERIATLSDELLVPETIILDGRERRHEDAIRLLVHKLGDYDTAVAYCLRRGSSIYTRPDGRRESTPTHDMQARLFRAVLGEFLAIGDVSDQIEQTGALLERFGGWFDVEDVLSLIPDNWSVDVIAGFLVTALRRITQERQETTVTRALSSAENLRINHDLIVKMDEKGPSIEAPN